MYKQFVFTLLLIIFVPILSFGVSYSENEVKATFILKFAHFTRWKIHNHNNTQRKDRTIIIGVYGKSVIAKYLNRLLSSNSEESANFNLIILKSIEDISKCDVVFIPKTSNKEFNKVKNVLEKLPVLTISDHEKFLEQGVMIVMFKKGKRVMYSINKKSIDASGLALRPKVYKLAVEILE